MKMPNKPIHALAVNRPDITKLASPGLTVSRHHSSLIGQLVRAAGLHRRHPIDAIFIPETRSYKVVGWFISRLTGAKLYTNWNYPEPDYRPVTYHPQITKAHIFTNLSTEPDQIGVLIQAYAAGKTVITAKVTGLEALLHDRQTCLLAADDTDASAHVSFLEAHPEEAYRLAKNGQMWIKQNWQTVLLPQIFALEISKAVQSS